MSSTAPSPDSRLLPVFSISKPGYLLAAVVALCLGLVFFSGLSLMVQWWSTHEEYSYGWFVPPLSAFLIWQQRNVLRRIPFTGSWSGVALMLAGLVLGVLGELSALYTLIQYGFLMCLTGTVLAVTGPAAFRRLGAALFLLLFMIPLPNFIYFNLSQQLQLVSSALGVGFVRLCGISVYLAGNVIDLGDYKLQVAEACSGLRYLFPLFTLGFIVALFFRAPLWQRALLVLSTPVITVLMNSFRIGIIGVLVNQYGTEQAEGFLHYFEGWVIFMCCLALLLLEVWLLLRLSGDRRSIGAALAVELPAPLPADLAHEPRPVPKQAWVAGGVLLGAALLNLLLPERAEPTLARTVFAEFPLQLDAWSGRHERLDDELVEALKFTDYLLANYGRNDTDLVNLYVAYYASQRKGESVHSPKGCLPGGGWVIERFGQHTLANVVVGGRPLSVNRVVISHGGERQLVYYWFQQRGRVMTNEYLVKWFLFVDALTRNRTDGALVRLVTNLPANEVRTAAADERLENFAAVLERHLSSYLPN